MSPFEVLFFDLNIKVSDKKFFLGVHDLRDSFVFSII